ncbi:MAG: flagellar biosynthesis/type III secretory pathway protein FliH [Yoonia sp.]|jgi:flagellar biosynthesis/type III secretory pathway protein FliH
MGQLLHLESFDNKLSEKTEDHPEFLRGFADGKSAGLGEATDNETDQLRALQGTLEDARFTYAEARQAVLADLNAVIEATISQFLPTLSAAGLVDALREDLKKSFEKKSPVMISLSVPPALAQLCEQIVADSGAGHVSVQPDPLIGEHAIWFKSDIEENCVDFEQALAAVRSALQCLQPQPKRNSENG